MYNQEGTTKKRGRPRKASGEAVSSSKGNGTNDVKSRTQTSLDVASTKKKPLLRGRKKRIEGPHQDPEQDAQAGVIRNDRQVEPCVESTSLHEVGHDVVRTAPDAKLKMGSSNLQAASDRQGNCEGTLAVDVQRRGDGTDHSVETQVTAGIPAKDGKNKSTQSDTKARKVVKAMRDIVEPGRSPAVTNDNGPVTGAVNRDRKRRNLLAGLGTVDPNLVNDVGPRTRHMSKKDDDEAVASGRKRKYKSSKKREEQVPPLPIGHSNSMHNIGSIDVPTSDPKVASLTNLTGEGPTDLPLANLEQTGGSSNDASLTKPVQAVTENSRHMEGTVVSRVAQQSGAAQNAEDSRELESQSKSSGPIDTHPDRETLPLMAAASMNLRNRKQLVGGSHAFERPRKRAKKKRATPAIDNDAEHMVEMTTSDNSAGQEIEKICGIESTNVNNHVDQNGSQSGRNEAIREENPRAKLDNLNVERAGADPVLEEVPEDKTEVGSSKGLPTRSKIVGSIPVPEARAEAEAEAGSLNHLDSSVRSGPPPSGIKRRRKGGRRKIYGLKKKVRKVVPSGKSGHEGQKISTRDHAERVDDQVESPVREVGSDGKSDVLLTDGRQEEDMHQQSQGGDDHSVPPTSNDGKLADLQGQRVDELRVVETVIEPDGIGKTEGQSCVLGTTVEVEEITNKFSGDLELREEPGKTVMPTKKKKGRRPRVNVNQQPPLTVKATETGGSSKGPLTRRQKGLQTVQENRGSVEESSLLGKQNCADTEMANVPKKRGRKKKQKLEPATPVTPAIGCEEGAVSLDGSRIPDPVSGPAGDREPRVEDVPTGKVVVDDVQLSLENVGGGLEIESVPLHENGGPEVASKSVGKVTVPDNGQRLLDTGDTGLRVEERHESQGHEQGEFGVGDMECREKRPLLESLPIEEELIRGSPEVLFITTVAADNPSKEVVEEVPTSTPEELLPANTVPHQEVQAVQVRTSVTDAVVKENGIGDTEAFWEAQSGKVTTQEPLKVKKRRNRKKWLGGPKYEIRTRARDRPGESSAYIERQDLAQEVEATPVRECGEAGPEQMLQPDSAYGEPCEVNISPVRDGVGCCPGTDTKKADASREPPDLLGAEAGEIPPSSEVEGHAEENAALLLQEDGKSHQDDRQEMPTGLLVSDQPQKEEVRGTVSEDPDSPSGPLNWEDARDDGEEKLNASNLQRQVEEIKAPLSQENGKSLHFEQGEMSMESLLSDQHKEGEVPDMISDDRDSSSGPLNLEDTRDASRNAQLGPDQASLPDVEEGTSRPVSSEGNNPMEAPKLITAEDELNRIAPEGVSDLTSSAMEASGPITDKGVLENIASCIQSVVESEPVTTMHMPVPTFADNRLVSDNGVDSSTSLAEPYPVPTAENVDSIPSVDRSGAVSSVLKSDTPSIVENSTVSESNDNTEISADVQPCVSGTIETQSVTQSVVSHADGKERAVDDGLVPEAAVKAQEERVSLESREVSIKAAGINDHVFTGAEAGAPVIQPESPGEHVMERASKTAEEVPSLLEKCEKAPGKSREGISPGETIQTSPSQQRKGRLEKNSAASTLSKGIEGLKDVLPTKITPQKRKFNSFQNLSCSELLWSLSASADQTGTSRDTTEGKKLASSDLFPSSLWHEKAPLPSQEFKKPSPVSSSNSLSKQIKVRTSDNQCSAACVGISILQKTPVEQPVQRITFEDAQINQSASDDLSKEEPSQVGRSGSDDLYKERSSEGEDSQKVSELRAEGTGAAISDLSHDAECVETGGDLKVIAEPEGSQELINDKLTSRLNLEADTVVYGEPPAEILPPQYKSKDKEAAHSTCLDADGSSQQHPNIEFGNRSEVPAETNDLQSQTNLVLAEAQEEHSEGHPMRGLSQVMEVQATVERVPTESDAEHHEGAEGNPGAKEVDIRVGPVSFDEDNVLVAEEVLIEAKELHFEPKNELAAGTEEPHSDVDERHVAVNVVGVSGEEVPSGIEEGQFDAELSLSEAEEVHFDPRTVHAEAEEEGLDEADGKHSDAAEGDDAREGTTPFANETIEVEEVRFEPKAIHTETEEERLDLTDGTHSEAADRTHARVGRTPTESEKEHADREDLRSQRKEVDIDAVEEHFESGDADESPGKSHDDEEVIAEAEEAVRSIEVKYAGVQDHLPEAANVQTEAPTVQAEAQGVAADTHAARPEEVNVDAVDVDADNADVHDENRKSSEMKDLHLYAVDVNFEDEVTADLDNSVGEHGLMTRELHEDNSLLEISDEDLQLDFSRSVEELVEIEGNSRKGRPALFPEEDIATTAQVPYEIQLIEQNSDEDPTDLDPITIGGPWEGDAGKPEEESVVEVEASGKEDLQRSQPAGLDNTEGQTNIADGVKASSVPKKRKLRAGHEGGERVEDVSRIQAQKKGFLLGSTTIESGGMRIRPRPLDPDMSLPVLVEGRDKEFYEFDGGFFHRWVQQHEKEKSKKSTSGPRNGGANESGGPSTRKTTWTSKGDPIFVPMFRELPDDLRSWGRAEKGRDTSSLSAVPSPKPYVPFENLPTRRIGHVLGRSFSCVPSVYDMDEEDEEWLCEYNSFLKPSDSDQPLSEETFEQLIELFEREFYRIHHGKQSGSPATSPDHVESAGSGRNPLKLLDQDSVQGYRSRMKASRHGAIDSNPRDGSMAPVETERTVGSRNTSEDCCICNGGENSAWNPVHQCQICTINVHQSCYGIREPEEDDAGEPVTSPSPNWCCRKCEAVVEGRVSPNISCAICCKSGGAMKVTVDPSKWAHVACALYTNETFFVDPEAMEPIDGLASVETRMKKQRERCGLCGVREGSCVRCYAKGCRAAFHISCGVIHGASFELQHAKQLVVAVRSFCPRHASFVPVANSDESQYAPRVRPRADTAEVVPGMLAGSSDPEARQVSPSLRIIASVGSVAEDTTAAEDSVPLNDTTDCPKQDELISTYPPSARKCSEPGSREESSREASPGEVLRSKNGPDDTSENDEQGVHGSTAAEDEDEVGPDPAAASGSQIVAPNFKKVDRSRRLASPRDRGVSVMAAPSEKRDHSRTRAREMDMTPKMLQQSVVEAVVPLGGAHSCHGLPRLDTLETRLAPAHVVKAVYSFWQSKRVKAGGPILHELKQIQAARFHGIFNKIVHATSEGGRPVVKHHMLSRGSTLRRPQGLSRDPVLVRLSELRQQLEMLRTISSNVVRREQLKRDDQKVMYESAQEQLRLARENTPRPHCYWCESTQSLLHCGTCPKAFCFQCFKHRRGYGVKGWIAATNLAKYVCSFCIEAASKERWQVPIVESPRASDQRSILPPSKGAILTSKWSERIGTAEGSTALSLGERLTFLKETLRRLDSPVTTTHGSGSSSSRESAPVISKGMPPPADGSVRTKFAPLIKNVGGKSVNRSYSGGGLMLPPRINSDDADDAEEDGAVGGDYQEREEKRLKRKKDKAMEKQQKRPRMSVLRSTKRIRKLARSSSFVYGSEDERTVSESEESRLDKKTVKLSELRDEAATNECTNLKQGVDDKEGDAAEKDLHSLKYGIKFSPSIGKLILRRHGSGGSNQQQ